jgi:hypothetical protein
MGGDRIIAGYAAARSAGLSPCQRADRCDARLLAFERHRPHYAQYLFGMCSATISRKD